MIHRSSRDALALALRRYVSRRITNDQLDSVVVDWRDRGAVAVQQMAWRLYDDNYSHKAVGRNALTPSVRREVAKWILFLKSNAEYLWPEYNFVRIAPGIGSFFTFGWWGRREARLWREFQEAGEIDAWPFISKDEERQARMLPPYLQNDA